MPARARHVVRIVTRSRPPSQRGAPRSPDPGKPREKSKARPVTARAAPRLASGHDESQLTHRVGGAPWSAAQQEASHGRPPRSHSHSSIVAALAGAWLAFFIVRPVRLHAAGSMTACSSTTSTRGSTRPRSTRSCRSTRSSRSARHSTAPATRRPLSIAGGRHAMGGQQFCTGGVLLDTRPLSRVLSLDEERGLVEVEAGIQWPALVDGARRDSALGDPPEADRRGRPLHRRRASRRTSTAAGSRYGPFVGDVESLVVVGADGERAHVLARRERRALPPRLRRLRPVRRRLLRDAPAHRRGARSSASSSSRTPTSSTRSSRADRARATSTATSSSRSTRVARLPPARDLLVLPAVADDTPLGAATQAVGATTGASCSTSRTPTRRAPSSSYAAHYLATAGQVYCSDPHQLATYVPRLPPGAGIRSEMITELYVPRPLLADFLAAAARDMRALEADIVYGTVRLIERDDESFLAWAREPWACVVLNLHVEHTPAGVEHAAVAFRRLIDLALERGGSFYLTYHRWATRGSSCAAYPQLPGVPRREARARPRRAASRATGTAGSARRSSWRRPRDLCAHRSRLDLPRRRARLRARRASQASMRSSPDPRRGSGPVVVYANAATPQGVEQPAVGRFLERLAGAGFVAVAPELPHVRQGEVTPETVDALGRGRGRLGPARRADRRLDGSRARDPRCRRSSARESRDGRRCDRAVREPPQRAPARDHGVLRRSALPGRAAARPRGGAVTRCLGIRTIRPCPRCSRTAIRGASTSCSLAPPRADSRRRKPG